LMVARARLAVCRQPVPDLPPRLVALQKEIAVRRRVEQEKKEKKAIVWQRALSIIVVPSILILAVLGIGGGLWLIIPHILSVVISNVSHAAGGIFVGLAVITNLLASSLSIIAAVKKAIELRNDQVHNVVKGKQEIHRMKEGSHKKRKATKKSLSLVIRFGLAVGFLLSLTRIVSVLPTVLRILEH